MCSVVRHLDIGCGYGGLTMALARLFPDKLVLGLEIRAKIVEYVKLKIEALRKEANDMVSFQNASCFRTNCQRYLPNYFKKGQVLHTHLSVQQVINSNPLLGAVGEDICVFPRPPLQGKEFSAAHHKRHNAFGVRILLA